MDKIAETVVQTTEQLFDTVFAPVFFEKLASTFGIVPKSKQEQVELLKLAKDLQDRGAVPTATTDSDARIAVLKEARAALNPNTSLHENAADALVSVFAKNPEVLKLAKTNLLAQASMMTPAQG